MLADSARSTPTLADVQAKHDEIVQLEKDIRELHDLIVDLAQLVEAQGGTFDLALEPVNLLG